MWLDLRGLGMEHDELLGFLANEAGVGLNDGLAFGAAGRGFVRMNMATSRALVAEALGRIADAWQVRRKKG